MNDLVAANSDPSLHKLPAAISRSNTCCPPLPFCFLPPSTTAAHATAIFFCHSCMTLLSLFFPHHTAATFRSSCTPLPLLPSSQLSLFCNRLYNCCLQTTTTSAYSPRSNTVATAGIAAALFFLHRHRCLPIQIPSEQTMMREDFPDDDLRSTAHDRKKVESL
ncbi:hypothetical protein GW17_00039659 [Ensete ventricosum]|nr:hypothetical protein GW17_00039659 [Ensete ventricosum]